MALMPCQRHRDESKRCHPEGGTTEGS